MKNQSRAGLFRFFLLALVIYLTGAGVYGFYANQRSRAEMLEALDRRLLLAAKSLKYMLADDFHDRAVDAVSISRQEELVNRDKISKFAQETEFVYVYTLAMQDGRFYFSAPTVTEQEAKERESWYFCPYFDAPAEFHEAFDRMAIKYVEYRDQWGRFRVRGPAPDQSGRNQVPGLRGPGDRLHRIAVLERSSQIVSSGHAPAALDRALCFSVPGQRPFPRKGAGTSQPGACGPGRGAGHLERRPGKGDEGTQACRNRIAGKRRKISENFRIGPGPEF